MQTPGPPERQDARFDEYSLYLKKRSDAVGHEPHAVGRVNTGFGRSALNGLLDSEAW
jgi:hypothetical protein